MLFATPWRINRFSTNMSDPNNYDVWSPWEPMRDQVAVKVLGKLAEEGGEIASAASRCLIQGIDAREPVTGKVNRRWLEDEIADIYANCKRAEDYFGLDIDYIVERATKKEENLKRWNEHQEK